MTLEYVEASQVSSEMSQMKSRDHFCQVAELPIFFTGYFSVYSSAACRLLHSKLSSPSSHHIICQSVFLVFFLECCQCHTSSRYTWSLAKLKKEKKKPTVSSQVSAVGSYSDKLVHAEATSFQRLDPATSGLPWSSKWFRLWPRQQGKAITPGGQTRQVVCLRRHQAKVNVVLLVRFSTST